MVPAYTPGEWLAVVTHGCVAFLPSDTTESTLHRVWESLQGADDAALVDHLQALAVGGLTALPPFALLQLADDRLHAVVRGPVEVHVLAADGARLLTAPHVATWSEEVVEAPEEVTVRASGSGGSDGGPAGVGALPVLSGVVRASEVRVRLAVGQGRPGVGQDRPAGLGVPDDTRSTAAVRALVAGAPVVSAVAGVPARGARAATTSAAAPLAATGMALASVLGAAVPAAVPSPAPVDGEPLDNTLLRPTAPAAASAPGAAGTARAEEVGTLLADAPLAGAPTSDVLLADDVLADDVLADVLADHDGTTVHGRDVAALRSRLPQWSGHAVPGAPAVPGPPTPGRARIALSTGERVSLARPVLLGRAPQASRVTSAQVPQLVTLPSPMQDISRTHAEVRMDGDDVVLTDLCSTNGVIVVRPAAAPQRLQPGEATVLEPGVLVDIGEGVSFTVERGA